MQEGNDVVLVQEYAEGGDLYRLLYKNGGRWAGGGACHCLQHTAQLKSHASVSNIAAAP